MCLNKNIFPVRFTFRFEGMIYKFIEKKHLRDFITLTTILQEGLENFFKRKNKIHNQHRSFKMAVIKTLYINNLFPYYRT